MIVGIHALPTGYPPGTTLSTLFPMTPDNSFMGGRVITTAPLLFYKIVSVYNDAVYEHVFASDTEIDPVRLESSRYIANGTRDTSYLGVFVPIAFKRMTSSLTRTYLFSRCIDWLLWTYQTGVPIDESLSNPSPSLVQRPEHVHSASEFNRRVFRETLQEQAGGTFTDYESLLICSITPEDPSSITNYVADIVGVGVTGKPLYDYMQEFISYESNTEIPAKEFVQRHTYPYTLDPITQLCVSTPSYVYGHELLGLLATPFTMEHSGYGPVGGIQNVPSFLTSAPYITANGAPYFVSDGETYYTLEDVIEAVMGIPDSTYRVCVDRDTFLVESEGAPVVPQMNVFEGLVHVLRNLYVHPRSTEYTKVVLMKTLGDEMVVELTRNGEAVPIVRYVNLTWYHLMSPCLINDHIVNRME